MLLGSFRNKKTVIIGTVDNNRHLIIVIRFDLNLKRSGSLGSLDIFFYRIY